MARAKKVAATGRGSPEAIAKRRVARKLNALFTGAGNETPMDGRTAKRRQRLLTELDKGTRKGGKLKPIEILSRVNELYTLGEPSSAIRKVVHVRKASHIPLQQAAEILREIHSAYSFRPDSYRFLGLPHDALVAAKILSPDAPRRGRPPTKNRSASR
jgi:hypothetical protein